MECSMYQKWDNFLRFLEKYNPNPNDHKKAAVSYICEKLKQQGKILNPKFEISEYPSKEKPFPEMEVYFFKEDDIGKMAQEIVTDMDIKRDSCGRFSWSENINKEYKFEMVYLRFKTLAELFYAYTFIEIVAQLDHIFNSLDSFIKYRKEKV